MKKRMKQMMAAIMATVMLLSVAVTASATQEISSLSETGTSHSADTNAVTNQGAIPADVIKVVMPTSSNNAFDMLFDSHQLIKGSASERYTLSVPGAGSVYYGADGKALSPVFEEGARLYFKNVTKTAAHSFITLPADVTYDTGVVIPKDTVADVYKVKTEKKVYFKKDDSTNKWLDSTGAACAMDSGEDYASIATLKTVDVETGPGLDAIDELNTASLINFHRNGTEVGAAATAAIAGLPEYVFDSYDDTAANVRYVATVGTTSYVLKLNSGTYEKDSVITTVADLTNSTNKYAQCPANLNVISYSGTSDKVTVINKSNATIGLSMSAELTGLPGGDGTSNTVVYADSMNNGDFLDIQGEKITDVPVFYFAMKDGVEADTTAMTYDTTGSKGTVKIDTKLVGHKEFFDIKWDSGNSKYIYQMKPTTRASQFSSMNFTLTGQINENDKWDNLLASANLKVTWTVKSYTPTLAEPSVTAGTLNVTKAWPVTVSGNKDNATITSVKAYTAANAGGTESNVTYTVTETGFTVPKNFFTTAPASIKVTFKGPADNEDLKNLTVDVVYDLD
jgi:hypothetical protein